ncbi:MAG TPA: type VII secretion target [Mycobacterium sp.]|nr:type VII secretion target [Mycobacterium sp.]
MGHLDAARVQVAALRDAARDYDSLADTVATARSHLAGLTFDGAVAGRSHAARGDALRASLGQIDEAMQRWTAANAGIAAVLRLSADRYADVDARSASRLG